jgi:hypothetical protein
VFTSCTLSYTNRVAGFCSLAVGAVAHDGLSVQAAAIAGIRALLVYATSERAKRFYEAHGFRASPLDPMTLTITLTETQRIIGDKRRS